MLFLKLYLINISYLNCQVATHNSFYYGILDHDFGELVQQNFTYLLIRSIYTLSSLGFKLFGLKVRCQKLSNLSHVVKLSNLCYLAIPEVSIKDRISGWLLCCIQKSWQWDLAYFIYQLCMDHIQETQIRIFLKMCGDIFEFVVEIISI